MVAKLTFHPLGAADCTRLDLADARKILVDYADMRDPNDAWDRRVDLPCRTEDRFARGQTRLL